MQCCSAKTHKMVPCECMTVHAACSSVYLSTNLSGLNDSEVIHTGYASTHGCSQTSGTKFHPGGEAFLESLHRSSFQQVLHRRHCLWVLSKKDL